MSPAETKTIKIRGVPFAATPEDLSQYFGGLFGEGTYYVSSLSMDVLYIWWWWSWWSCADVFFWV